MGQSANSSSAVTCAQTFNNFPLDSLDCRFYSLPIFDAIGNIRQPARSNPAHPTALSVSLSVLQIKFTTQASNNQVPLMEVSAH